MRARYNESFKRQAVGKALSRSQGTTLVEVSNSLGIDAAQVAGELEKAAIGIKSSP